MKYSMTCPTFLMKSWIKPSSCDEISGARKRMTVMTNEDVFLWENVSVDIQKTRAIPNTTGSQYLRKYCLQAILGLIY